MFMTELPEKMDMAATTRSSTTTGQNQEGLLGHVERAYGVKTKVLL